jgi:hypothetical protein
MITYEVFRNRIDRERRGKNILAGALAVSLVLNWGLGVFIWICLSR